MVKTDLVGKFAHVLGSAYEEYGLPEGSLVFIAGSGFSPVDDDDNFKLLFIVAEVKDDVPHGNGVTLARKSLQVVSDEENAELHNKMEEVVAKQAQAANEAQ